MRTGTDLYWVPKSTNLVTADKGKWFADSWITLPNNTILMARDTFDSRPLVDELELVYDNHINLLKETLNEL